MSVINRVLRDLDGQKAAGPLPPGVRSVPAPASRSGRRAAWLLVLPPLAVAVWYLMPPKREPVAALPPEPVAAAPAAVAPAPVVTPSAVEATPTANPVPAQADTARPAFSTLTMATEVTLAPRPAADPATRGTTTGAAQVVKQAQPPRDPRQQAEANYARAASLVESGKPREAMALVEEALAHDPGHAGARQSAVALALEAGDRTRAEALLREGMRLHPGEVWFVRSLAQLSIQRGDYAGAADLLRGGLGHADADYHGLYAGVLAKVGRNEAAAAEYRDALKGNPDQGVWWLGLALALERGGNRAEAAAAYERAAQTRLAPEVREFVSRKRAELN